MDDGILQLQTRIDQLTKLNSDHRRRASLSRRQAQQLIEDKAELQALLHDRDQEISHIRDRLKRYSRDAAVDGLPSEVQSMVARQLRRRTCDLVVMGSNRSIPGSCSIGWLVGYWDR